MEKLIILLTFTVFCAFNTANSLQCYQCVDCPTVSDSQLMTCEPETPTTVPPTTTTPAPNVTTTAPNETTTAATTTTAAVTPAPNVTTTAPNETTTAATTTTAAVTPAPNVTTAAPNDTTTTAPTTTTAAVTPDLNVTTTTSNETTTTGAPNVTNPNNITQVPSVLLAQQETEKTMEYPINSFSGHRATNSTIVYYCYKATLRDINGTDAIVRGCGSRLETSNQTICNVVEEDQAVTQCSVCNTDGCNSGFTLKFSVLLLFITFPVSLMI